jgi:hypothetical protein
MKRWQYVALGGLAAAAGVVIWKRKDIAVEVKMIGVNPASAIPDKAVVPYSPVDAGQIQAALVERDSYLLDKSIGGILGIGGKPFATWLDQVGGSNGVHPWLLAIKYQHEQSGLTLSRSLAAQFAKKPYTWVEYTYANGRKTDEHVFNSTRLAYIERWALGFGAREDGFDTSFGGFEKQFQAAADYFKRKMAEYAGGGPALVHQPIVVDGKQMVPLTAASRMFLRYTPHADSILDLRRLFERYAPDLVKTTA